MPSVGKKLHHFVPRFYLRAWASNEQLFCLQKGRVTPRHLEKVAAENYFYRLNEISPEDAEFVEKMLIEDSPEGLKESHRFLLHSFTLPHQAKRMLEESGNATPEAMAFINQQIVELNENYHTSIENLFRPILNSMRAGDLTFLGDEERKFAFYFGLSVQYARTNHIKANRLLIKQQDFERYIRTGNLLTHIIATNAAHSLLIDQKRYVIILLENPTEIPFVTADQPVINLSANPKEFKPPAKFELFYPLSPTMAMMLLESESVHLPRGQSVSGGQAHLYNLHMAAHSFRQVYSNSKPELGAINSELDAFLSCF